MPVPATYQAISRHPSDTSSRRNRSPFRRKQAVARFQKGVSGNPGGRPKKGAEKGIKFDTRINSALREALKTMSKADLVALARSHAPEAVQTLLDCLRDPRHRVAAATALLDRGYGKPQVEIAGAEDRPLAIAFSWAPAQMPASPVDTAPVIDATNDQLKVVWDRAANGEE